MENFADVSLWSNEQVLSTAVKYGEEARKWKNKFLGLLPEIRRRKLYEQRGFSSILHFAKVIGSVSEEQVSRVLNLEKSFQNKPNLHAALVSGKISVSKLARVTSIATPENEEELATIVQALPKNALETFVRDTKQVSVPGHKPENNSIFEQDKLKLDSDVEEELLELQKKGININGIIRSALRQRQQIIQQEKEEIVATCTETDSRYIPARTRKLLTQEHGTKCSIKNCNKASRQIHHTQRFSMAKTHDPHYLAPLCKAHHTLAHTIDTKYQEKRMGSL